MAQLKDLLVTGAARFLGDIYGNLKGTADKAIADKNGRPLNNIAYATCTTAAGDQDKVISINNFTLSPGTTIRVKFTYNNSAASPNLKVNGTSEPINLYGSSAAGASDTTSGWRAGAIVPFTYDGTQWIRDYWENSNTWRGIQNNLTSDATDQSLSAAQGKVLKGLVDGKAASSHTHNYAGSSSAGGAANSANKLNTNAGSSSQPVYFANGIPVACTDVGATVLRDYYNVSFVGLQGQTEIDIPETLAENFDSNSILLVYHNGVLLENGVNYTVSSDNTQINLTYECVNGDLFSFVLITKTLKGLDLGEYLTPDRANNLYAPKDNTYAEKTECLLRSGGTMTGPIDMGKQNITNCNSITATTITASGKITGNQVYGAVWNDYAEYRTADSVEPGIVVCENGDDTMSISKERMQPGAAIVSDTFGFAIGETDKAKTPIAVSGRVLAKPYEPIEEFKKAIGRPVCAGPDGTVSIMTDEEYSTKGYCAIGTISAVPNYTTWSDGIKVNNRVWIKVG